MTSFKSVARRLALALPFVRRVYQQPRPHGMFAPGHYYSPIPSRDDVREHLARREDADASPADIDLATDAQFEWLRRALPLYGECPFPETPSPSNRYHLANDWFSYSDAVFLYLFLRSQQPARIIEVGSGFSTAAMLDTFDAHFEDPPVLTCIEPWPERLLDRLRPEDRSRLTLHEMRVQDLPLEVFDTLESGDLLFIDSSHVLKCGSDLHVLLFEVLPCLAPGVFVHFHDVFHPFDYPKNWLREGRYWNEAYLLRAFLMGNRDWQIELFSDYVNKTFAEWLTEHMPLCRKNTGGSLYLRKRSLSP